MPCVWPGVAVYDEPHVPCEPADSVVLLRFPHLPLPLLLLYVSAQLAHFRQRKTKGDRAHSKKKAAKRTGPAVDAPVPEASPVASEDGGGVGPGDACQSSSCSEPPEGAGAAQVNVLSIVPVLCLSVLAGMIYEKGSLLSVCPS